MALCKLDGREAYCNKKHLGQRHTKWSHINYDHKNQGKKIQEGNENIEKDEPQKTSKYV